MSLGPGPPSVGKPLPGSALPTGLGPDRGPLLSTCSAHTRSPHRPSRTPIIPACSVLTADPQPGAPGPPRQAGLWVGAPGHRSRVLLRGQDLAGWHFRCYPTASPRVLGGGTLGTMGGGGGAQEGEGALAQKASLLWAVKRAGPALGLFGDRLPFRPSAPLPLQGPLKAVIVAGIIPDARLAGSTPVRSQGPASAGGAASRAGCPPLQRTHPQFRWAPSGEKVPATSPDWAGRPPWRPFLQASHLCPYATRQCPVLGLSVPTHLWAD